MKEPEILCIRDTGIGIAPEDLPRIFEKGYTGYTGREDKKASGIGLYLCKRICNNLGHSIAASSIPDKGTEIRIDLSQRKLDIE
jgi:signal transduction histidine kinase